MKLLPLRGPVGLGFVLLSLVLCLRAHGDNIILFIGDGMGFGHVKAGRAFVHGSTASLLDFEQLGLTGQSVTVLPNGTVTDSATAGTALATGYQHPLNGVISMGANNSIKTTILEYARDKGYRTGIITTDEIGGATPGTFGAHEPDRNLTGEIRNDYFFTDVTYGHAASLPNVLLGGGYDDPTIVFVTANGDKLTLVGGALSQNYDFVNTSSGLSAPVSYGDLLGLFGSSWVPMTGMAYRPANSQEPTLSQMVVKALEVLGGGSGGLFLMVEGANIDKFSHSNDAHFVDEVAELNRAVQVAKTWAGTHANTLIMVTADHETGGVSAPDQTITPGTLPYLTFSSTGHTTANVPVFTTWPAALNGLTIDNTEVFFVMEDYLNLPSGHPPEIANLVISGVSESGATVQWNTVEPSDGRVEIILDPSNTAVFSNPTRVTAHSIDCSGLIPGTTYALTARSRDLAGFQSSISTSFTTKAAGLTVTVTGEPVVAHGSVSGNYLGVLTPNDGVAQRINETPDGTGSSCSAEYQLHTSMPVDQIGSLTLQGNLSWTQSDGAADKLVIEVFSLSKGWQPIQLPFTLFDVTDHVDGSGNLRIQFRDSASFRREKKDALSIDLLAGTITPVSSSAPTFPVGATLTVSDLTSSSAQLSWIDAEGEDGYEVFRNDVLIASLPANTLTYTDSGLSPFTSYAYAVWARNSRGPSVELTATAQTTLAAPVNLTAAGVKGAVSLSWSDLNPSGTTFSVYRDTIPNGDFGNCIAANLTSTSYSDTAAPRGTTFYYRVQSVYSGQYGPYSSVVSAKAR